MIILHPQASFTTVSGSVRNVPAALGVQIARCGHPPHRECAHSMHASPENAPRGHVNMASAQYDEPPTPVGCQRVYPLSRERRRGPPAVVAVENRSHFAPAALKKCRICTYGAPRNFCWRAPCVRIVRTTSPDRSLVRKRAGSDDTRSQSRIRAARRTDTEAARATETTPRRDRMARSTSILRRFHHLGSSERRSDAQTVRRRAARLRHDRMIAKSALGRRARSTLSSAQKTESVSDERVEPLNE